MDMIKQTLAAFLGSIALAGCLTDPSLVNVPQPVSTDLVEDGSDTDGEPLVLAPVDSQPTGAAVAPRPSPGLDDPAQPHESSRRMLLLAVGWSA